MAEPPLKPVLQKPPGFRDQNFPTQSAPKPVMRTPLLPQSYHPKKRRSSRRSRGCCRSCCCFFCCLILILIVIVGVASAIFYLWFLPKTPVFRLQSFRIPRFNVTVKPDGTYLDAQTLIRVEAKNPNGKLSLFYKDIHVNVNVKVGAKADPTELGSGKVAGFTQRKRNTTSLKVETNVKNQLVDDGEGAKLKASFKSKGLVVSVEARTGLGYIVRGLKIGPLGVKVLCGGVSLKGLEDGKIPKCTINTLKWINIH
ncbi:NDR1/HIN1-like protein 6 [Quercus robur]|uniref:NDR1/HIN1-like protein 6 n=1 Tax=Quercus robur TaxID=38942 RepID=UPI002163C999|nr:NDR1/HIN1-like protein 6 [Quercus robur]